MLRQSTFWKRGIVISSREHPADIWGRREESLSTPSSSVHRVTSGNLSDLLKSVALDSIEEYHGGHVVTLGVPFDRPRIGNPLVTEVPKRTHHIGARREAPLGVRGSLYSEKNKPCRVIRAHCIVGNGAEPLRVALRKRSRARHPSHRWRGREHDDSLAARRRPLCRLNEAFDVPAAVSAGEELIQPLVP